MNELQHYADRLDALVRQLEPAQIRKLTRELARTIRRSVKQRIAANQAPDGSAYTPRSGLQGRPLRKGEILRQDQPFIVGGELKNSAASKPPAATPKATTPNWKWAGNTARPKCAATTAAASPSPAQAAASCSANSTATASSKTHGYPYSISAGYKNEKIAHIDQTNESDAAFLTRLAEQYDAVATVKNGRLLFIRTGQAETAGGQPIEEQPISRASGDGHSFTYSAAKPSCCGSNRVFLQLLTQVQGAASPPLPPAAAAAPRPKRISHTCTREIAYCPVAVSNTPRTRSARGSP